MTKFSIITPVWNRSDLTARFLAHHQEIYSGCPEIEWIIIDNGSTDETSEIMYVWQLVMSGQLEHIRLEENTGFGPANNRGAEIATGDVLVFLSNDVQIKGDYLSLIYDTVQHCPNALYGAEIFSHDTGWNTFKQSGIIPYVAGWCVIADARFWKKIGPWDERYIPCDYEDLDLSYHVQQLNYPIYELDLPLKHDSGKSAQALTGGRLPFTLKNRERFLEKWGLTQR